ncbi:hypothetical protein SUGI_1015750 [Cryptomeria japonica]|nr:hypothetical protein SUGI_1015750 [Cryptomeria japonica]
MRGRAEAVIAKEHEIQSRGGGRSRGEEEFLLPGNGLDVPHGWHVSHGFMTANRRGMDVPHGWHVSHELMTANGQVSTLFRPKLMTAGAKVYPQDIDNTHFWEGNCNRHGTCNSTEICDCELGQTGGKHVAICCWRIVQCEKVKARALWSCYLNGLDPLHGGHLSHGFMEEDC